MMLDDPHHIVMDEHTFNCRLHCSCVGLCCTVAERHREPVMTLTIPLLYAAILLPSMAYRLHDVAKRSDDTPPLEATVLQHSSEIGHLKAQLAALQTKLDAKNHNIAFRAQFSSSVVNSPASGPFQFDTVIFNDGNGYDPATGIFTAPVSGVYLFTAQIFSQKTQNTRVFLEFKLNGNFIIRMAFDPEHDGPAIMEESDSTAFTVKLQAGDRMWLASPGAEIYHLFGPGHTFFSGALLYAQ